MIKRLFIYANIVLEPTVYPTNMVDSKKGTGKRHVETKALKKAKWKSHLKKTLGKKALGNFYADSSAKCMYD